MQTITTIGLDIAKSVFQVHGVDAGGQVIVRRQLKRRYVLTYFQKLSPCLVGIEACASAHRRLTSNHMVRPDGAYYQWRKDPPRELSIDLVADERFGRAIGRTEAS